MGKYATNTNVPVEKSRLEIERVLGKYNADRFAYATEGNKALIRFGFNGRMMQYILILPDKNEKEFIYHSRGRRTPEAALAQWELACRQKWRALLIGIKGKLEMVESGITSIEEEFAPQTVMPNGQTLFEWVQPQIEQAYLDGKMPTQLLLGAPNAQ